MLLKEFCVNIFTLWSNIMFRFPLFGRGEFKGVSVEDILIAVGGESNDETDQ